MEYVKHHVERSGNAGLRGFFASDAVDFDPPSASLRINIMKAKAKVVYDLASGFTPDSEERAKTPDFVFIQPLSGEKEQL